MTTKKGTQMNDHQNVAVYINQKLLQCPITGAESENMTSAKQWLALIVSGQFIVVSAEEQQNAKVQPDLLDRYAVGNGISDDAETSPGGTD
jgi:hypothetical protein